MKIPVETFRMPRYREIPDMGLYLDQTVKYINGFLMPLGCAEITSSMVSNYVKKGFVPSPRKKLYFAEHISVLFFIALTKSVLSMENIGRLFEIQEKTYSRQEAYDYFCSELEDALCRIFGHKEDVYSILQEAPAEKKMLQSVVFTAANIIYLNHCFDAMTFDEEEK